MKTPTLAPVSFQHSPISAAGYIHVRALRKPAGMTPRQWKRAWRRPWIGPDRRTGLAIQIQDANPTLYCGGLTWPAQAAPFDPTPPGPVDEEDARREREWQLDRAEAQADRTRQHQRELVDLAHDVLVFHGVD